MRINTFSAKQREIFDFINSADYALICDGSVRSGKTTVMLMAFLMWAMSNYNRTNFAICGKTIQSVERNVLMPLLEIEGLPFTLKYKASTRVLTVRCGKRVNWFYFFGGKDESSYMLIQGITLAGVMFDEVALMPQSFVQQALARTISFESPKYFFNCNPESPNHYFYKEWIEHPKEHTRHIHFQLEDNPTLTAAAIERTKADFAGVFYDRYILGKWVLAEGRVYPMYDNTVATVARNYERYYISVDFGIQNPTAAILWGLSKGVWYAIKEYYHSGREMNEQKTVAQYSKAIEELAGDLPIKNVIIDPSAAPLISELNSKHKFTTWKARNDVISGIQHTASCLQDKTIMFNDCCKRTIEEFGLYRWDEKAAEDKPIKENDHCLVGETLVDTAGGQKRIDELLGQEGYVYCTNGGKVQIGHFHSVRKTREAAEVYKITLLDGRTVTATAEHPVLTERGWVMLKDLRMDDKIACIGGKGNERNLQRRRENSIL